MQKLKTCNVMHSPWISMSSPLDQASIFNFLHIFSPFGINLPKRSPLWWWRRPRVHIVEVRCEVIKYRSEGTKAVLKILLLLMKLLVLCLSAKISELIIQSCQVMLKSSLHIVHSCDKGLIHICLNLS